MLKVALLATALAFAGTNLAVALPGPAAAVGVAAASGDVLTPVREKKKAKKAKKASKSGGGMNMQGMPPGHKM